MYLYTDRVYNQKIDYYIKSTKAIRWKIALGCFDYFFHLNFSNNNKIFQLNRFKEND